MIQPSVLQWLKSVTDFLSLDSDFDRILTWLVMTDPSPNHKMACQLHKPQTGQWLTKSPEYMRWKSFDLRFLWLHGIPGAGKTVLLSYIAEDIKTYSQSNHGSDIAWDIITAILYVARTRRHIFFVGL